jgi:hypothetical protein
MLSREPWVGVECHSSFYSNRHASVGGKAS